MGKNVAVFVDVANVFYAAKAAGVDIDYVTLLKSVTAGRDLVRAYAYTGLDPENDNQRNFHDFLRRSGYKVVSKDIRKYGDGKVKANLDIELVVDMMKTARNLDIAIVVSGDGDFAPAIRAVQEQGVRVEVLSFRGNTSSDLIEVADLFTDIAQIAKVEKGSSRSGRRVASDDEDLSMTEVPDKMSEGTGTRGRGRGRGRSRSGEAEPVAAASRTRTRSRAAAPVRDEEDAVVAAVTPNGLPLVVLPGEKLSRVAARPAPAVHADGGDEEPELDDEAAEATRGPVVEGESEAEATRRRRRRRGGRGRGRGRGRDEVAAGAPAPDDADADEEDADEEVAAAPGPAKRSVHTFGSVWDSQIGVPAPSAGAGAGAAPLDEDDFDEPPIPEYLIAERRQQGGRGGRPGAGGRGTRSGYAAAIERERYGGGRGGGTSRFGDSPRRPSGPSGRDAGRDAGRDRFRTDRPAPRPEPRSSNPDEPWSDVPPEIEAMLRAQLGAKARPAAPAPAPRVAADADTGAAPAAPAGQPAKRRATRKPAAEAATEASTMAPAADDAAPTPTKRRATRTKAGAEAGAEAVVETPKRRATRKPAAAAADKAAAEATDDVKAATPKRRSTRTKAAPAAEA